MRLRICQIVPTLDQGGAEKQLSLLATGLDSTRFESHVVVLTHSGPLENVLRDRGVQVHLIGKRGKLDVTALGRLTAKLRQLAPHVVHTWLFAANSYGRLAARRARVPVVIGGERCVDPWKRWWHFAIDRWLLKYTDRVVTNTSAVQHFYAAHGLPADRFTVIPNAIEPFSGERLSRAEVFERLNIEPNEFLIMAVGRLWPQKGYKDLIWAGELVRVALESVRLVIVGDGPLRERLLHFRDQSGASEAVRFVGHREDAAQLLSGADLLWNGSLYEGQSNTILEAMNVGVTVVATDIPGNRDLVADGKTGYLYKVGDIASLVQTSVQLMRDPERRAALGWESTKRVRTDFSPANMIAAHEALYEQLCAEKKVGIS